MIAKDVSVNYNSFSFLGGVEFSFVLLNELKFLPNVIFLNKIKLKRNLKRLNRKVYKC